jgi:hypothetical protein
MQPDPRNFFANSYCLQFGELDENNYMHGRGIELRKNGDILIGFFENGGWSTGHYICIYSDGRFLVGEKYLKDDVKWDRGTEYKI